MCSYNQSVLCFLNIAEVRLCLQQKVPENTYMLWIMMCHFVKSSGLSLSCLITNNFGMWKVEIWCYHGGENADAGLLGCKAVWICGCQSFRGVSPKCWQGVATQKTNINMWKVLHELLEDDLLSHFVCLCTHKHFLSLFCILKVYFYVVLVWNEYVCGRLYLSACLNKVICGPLKDEDLQCQELRIIHWPVVWVGRERGGRNYFGRNNR
jgi:hypothetical protein